MRMIQNPFVEGVSARRILIPQNPRDQANQSLNHHQGREFPSGKHIVPDRYFVGNQRLPYPFIYPLIAAADKDQTLLDS